MHHKWERAVAQHSGTRAPVQAARHSGCLVSATDPDRLEPMPPPFVASGMSVMTSGDEKDPPVPADLVGAPERIRREQGRSG
jgi:hypothetical protein